jgi:hypothetical protein
LTLFSPISIRGFSLDSLRERNVGYECVPP